MKEATGELNMTVVVVIAIAAIAALFYAFVWPAIRGNLTASTRCSAAFGCGACDGNIMTCQGYYDDNGETVEDEIQCQCGDTGRGEGGAEG